MLLWKRCTKSATHSPDYIKLPEFCKVHRSVKIKVKFQLEELILYKLIHIVYVQFTPAPQQVFAHLQMYVCVFDGLLAWV